MDIRLKPIGEQVLVITGAYESELGASRLALS